MTTRGGPCAGELISIVRSESCLLCTGWLLGTGWQPATVSRWLLPLVPSAVAGHWARLGRPRLLPLAVRRGCSRSPGNVAMWLCAFGPHRMGPSGRAK